MRMVLAALGLAALGVAPATADDRPAMFPQRDVVVQYHVTNARPDSAQPREGIVTVHATDGGARMRVEIAGQPGFMIVDRGQKRVLMVIESKHSYFEMPVDPERVMGLAVNEGSFTKRGADTVAKVRCTVWDVKSRTGTATVCVTDDGVLLRANGASEGRGSGAMEALSVVYGKQPAGLFDPPPGFQKLEMLHPPTGMPMPGSPPG
jgi:hypothetical protein